MADSGTEQNDTAAPKDRETRNKILASAEALFFLNESADFSLRELTGHAGISLATVNYHFGSKENLYLALLIRAGEHVYANRAAWLASARQDGGSTAQRLRSLLRSLIQPVICYQGQPDMGRLYIAMIAKSSSEAPEELARTLLKQSSHLYRHFLAVKALMPNLSEEELVWRLYFVLSIEFGVHKGHPYLGGLYGKTGSPDGEDIVERVLDFAVPGMMAKASRSTEK
jgi:AcrR family transcriptional regulator